MILGFERQIPDASLRKSRISPEDLAPLIPAFIVAMEELGPAKDSRVHSKPRRRHSFASTFAPLQFWPLQLSRQAAVATEEPVLPIGEVLVRESTVLLVDRTLMVLWIFGPSGHA